MFLAPWSRSRLKKKQEPEPEPLGEKNQEPEPLEKKSGAGAGAGAGAAKKFAGSPALGRMVKKRPDSNIFRTIVIFFLVKGS